MTTDDDNSTETPTRRAPREHLVYPAVIAVIASASVLAYLAWKYYGINGSLLIGVLVTFALFRVLRPARPKSGRQNK